MITQDRLRKLFAYDPKTGMFRRLMSTSSNAHIGDEAGCARWDGYHLIRIDGKLYLSHRLAWLYVHADWPANGVDHINGDPSDNRISNLREATQSQNCMNRGAQVNNRSGFKGVCWHKRAGKWTAEATADGKRKHLGLFLTAEAAHAAYRKFIEQHHGKFAKAA